MPKKSKLGSLRPLLVDPRNLNICGLEANISAYTLTHITQTPRVATRLIQGTRGDDKTGMKNKRLRQD